MLELDEDDEVLDELEDVIARVLELDVLDELELLEVISKVLLDELELLVLATVLLEELLVMARVEELLDE